MRLFPGILLAALTMTSAHAAPADAIALPPMPAAIEAPAGHRPFLMAHAVGTQNYVCAPSAAGVAWTFIGPQATLFDEDMKQITTHFLSPNPQEAGLARATWQHSRDTSAVWARAIATSSDPVYVAPGAIPWLLLEVVGSDTGPTGGGRLAATTFIQRVSTEGGVAPSTGCATPADVNKRAFVPYETKYVFYRMRHGRGH